MEIKKLEGKESWDVSFDATASKEEWQGYLKDASLELQKRKAVPGYRAGKAPLGVAKKHYGKTLIEAASAAARKEMFEKACMENGYAPVSDPIMLDLQADEDGFSVHCSFQDYPKLTQLNYRGLKPEKPLHTVTEAEIDQEIDKYMRNHLYVHEVPREARMNDIVQVNFNATHEGESFYYDHARDVRFIMGSGQLFTGLDEVLVGHVAGDDIDVTLTMPEDFHRENVRGWTLNIHVHLVGVWARDLLECTDEYVKEHIKDCETVADFREQQRAKKQDLSDRESERRYKDNLEKALAEAVTDPLPPAMLDTAIGRFVGTLGRYAAQSGGTAESLLAAEGKTMEDYINMCRVPAEQQVRMSVALDYIIQNEKLEVSQEALTERLQRYADIDKTSAQEAADKRGGVEQIYSTMLNDMAMKIVADTAEPQIVEVESYYKEGTIIRD